MNPDEFPNYDIEPVEDHSDTFFGCLTVNYDFHPKAVAFMIVSYRDLSDEPRLQST
jgi:hypothetical protein